MSDSRYEQQADEISLLKDRINKLEQSNEKLQKAEKIYRALFEHAGFSISVRSQRENQKFFIYNKAEYESLGYSRDEIEELSDDEVVIDSAEEREKNRAIVNRKGSHFFETRQRAKNGDIRHRFISSVRLLLNDELYHLNIASDITEMKKVENELKEARDELEVRVENRTAELKRKTMELKKSNTALKVLLQKRDEAILDIEERLLKNTKQLVSPHIENLKKTTLNDGQIVSLMELELNLEKILSPFLHRLSNQYQNLTPTEIKVAALIREGRTSKELAHILGSSIKTIETHRTRLRKKLGIKNHKVNLQSYLKTYDAP